MKNILYNSTRGGEKGLSASEAILKGLALDGGLFMPNTIPSFDFSLDSLKGKNYRDVAYEVMKLFLTDYSKEELLYCINSAYDDKFDDETIAPLVKADGAYYLELFHGPTIAFKDMALSILPYLLTTAAKKKGVTDKIVILTATSGDTGKAAMAGFADVEGTGIIVFYPKGGVSKIQELQMRTQKGNNTSVVAIHGNFDDAQTGVKNIFGDKDFTKKLKENGIVLSSANSINIGRLVPQIVYYVYAYINLLSNSEIEEGEKINICVPTGNFGNVLAAYIAKLMGLPVNKLIVASNDNKVLVDFFETGVYDKNREFILTSSPSMDILISSNLERLVYLANDCDADLNAKLMKDLSEKGKYEISENARENMKDFVSGYATESNNAAGIKKLYEDTDYLIDTHTGVASYVYEEYKNKTKDATKTVIASTASPYKFSEAVIASITDISSAKDEWDIIDMMEKISGVEIPKAVTEIKEAEILHDIECDIKDMRNIVEKILKI